MIALIEKIRGGNDLSAFDVPGSGGVFAVRFN